MKIKTFKVERWMNEYEDDAVYNLGETCIDSMTIKRTAGTGGRGCGEIHGRAGRYQALLQPHLRFS